MHQVKAQELQEKRNDISKKIGIEKSLEAVSEADIVISLFDNSKPCDNEDEKILDILQKVKFFSVIIKIVRNSTCEQQFARQLNEWMDAFRTLKFIHHCRDIYYPNLPLKQAMSKAQFPVL